MSFSNRLGAFGYPAQEAFHVDEAQHGAVATDEQGVGSIVQSMIDDSARL